MTLDELNGTQEGCVVCFNAHLSGQNMIRLLLKGFDHHLEIAVTFFNCKIYCEIWVQINGNWNGVSDKIPPGNFGWMFVCLEVSPPPLNKLKVAVNQIEVIETSITSLPTITSMHFFWKSNQGYVFPEKITLVNIHSKKRKVGNFRCGDPGDLYSWNIALWREERNNTIPITKDIKNHICNNKQVLILPKVNFERSLKVCTEVSNGRLLYETIEEFKEIVNLDFAIKEEKHYYWLPFAEIENTQKFINIYNNNSFDASLFSLGQPDDTVNGDTCLMWYTELGTNDVHCQVERLSVCLGSNQNRTISLRGICQQSKIDYHFSLAKDANHSLGWISTKNTFIQYNALKRSWSLRNTMAFVTAEINSNYENFLIGTHEWKIYNDYDCSKEKVYFTNISLRL